MNNLNFIHPLPFLICCLSFAGDHFVQINHIDMLFWLDAIRITVGLLLQFQVLLVLFVLETLHFEHLELCDAVFVTTAAILSVVTVG